MKHQAPSPAARQQGHEEPPPPNRCPFCRAWLKWVEHCDICDNDACFNTGSTPPSAEKENTT